MNALEQIAMIGQRSTSDAVIYAGIVALGTLAAASAYLLTRRKDQSVAQNIGAEPVVSEPKEPSYFPTTTAGIKTKIDDEYRPVEVVARVEDFVKCGPQKYTGILSDTSGKVPFFMDLEDVCTYDWHENAQVALLLRNSAKNNAPILLQGVYDDEFHMFEVERLAGDVVGQHYNLGVGEDD